MQASRSHYDFQVKKRRSFNASSSDQSNVCVSDCTVSHNDFQGTKLKGTRRCKIQNAQLLRQHTIYTNCSPFRLVGASKTSYSYNRMIIVRNTLLTIAPVSDVLVRTLAIQNKHAVIPDAKVRNALAHLSKHSHSMQLPSFRPVPVPALCYTSTRVPNKNLQRSHNPRA